MISFQYITDFYKSRGGRIGASDLPALIPHPDRPSESLAGYGQTALTLYEEKIGLREREPSGFAAEMGHFLEPKALYEFIRDFAEPLLGESIANNFYHGYMLCEFERVKNKNLNCRPFNNTAFKHHTEAMNDFGVAHADCVYEPDAAFPSVTKHGHTVNFSKPFLIEAKSAQYWSVKLRKKDRFSGYDLDLKEWQGIPLKHYFQIQYQMALYDVDIAYLALIYNTSEKHYWQIKANDKHQTELFELAHYMKQCIDKRTPPKQLAMNAADIRKLYPEIQDDFIEIIGDELNHAIEIVKQYRHAQEQEKAWSAKKEDAENAMSILLKDKNEIKGMVEDSLQTIARWKSTGGGEKVRKLSEIKIDYPKIYNYLKRNDMIEEKNTGEKPDIKLKLEE